MLWDSFIRVQVLDSKAAVEICQPYEKTGAGKSAGDAEMAANVLVQVSNWHDFSLYLQSHVKMKDTEFQPFIPFLKRHWRQTSRMLWEGRPGADQEIDDISALVVFL